MSSYITDRELSEKYRIPRPTVYNWIKNNRVKVIEDDNYKILKNEKIIWKYIKKRIDIPIELYKSYKTNNSRILTSHV